MSDSSDYADDVELVQADDTTRAEITMMAKRMLALEDEAKQIQENLNRVNEEHRRLAEIEIPEAMLSIGEESFRMLGGRTITIAKKVRASISEASKDDAFLWLRRNGFEDLIKHQVTVSFGMKEAGDARILLEFLQEQFPGRPVSNKETVHSSTLNAWSNEQFVKGGKTAPPSIYVDVRTVATVKDRKSSL